MTVTELVMKLINTIGVGHREDENLSQIPVSIKLDPDDKLEDVEASIDRCDGKPSCVHVYKKQKTDVQVA